MCVAVPYQPHQVLTGLEASPRLLQVCPCSQPSLELIPCTGLYGQDLLEAQSVRQGGSPAEPILQSGNRPPERMPHLHAFRAQKRHWQQSPASWPRGLCWEDGRCCLCSCSSAL